jgi:hypothetical protein
MTREEKIAYLKGESSNMTREEKIAFLKSQNVSRETSGEKLNIPEDNFFNRMGLQFAAGGENLTNVFRGFGRAASPVGFAIPELQDKTITQDVASAMRPQQSTIENILSGVIQNAPYFAGPTGAGLFAADVAGHPEKILDIAKAPVETAKLLGEAAGSIPSWAPGHVTPSEMKTPESERAIETIKTHPVETALGVGIPLTMLFGAGRGAVRGVGRLRNLENMLATTEKIAPIEIPEMMGKVKGGRVRKSQPVNKPTPLVDIPEKMSTKVEVSPVSEIKTTIEPEIPKTGVVQAKEPPVVPSGQSIGLKNVKKEIFSGDRPIINPKTYELNESQQGQLLKDAETIRPEMEKVKGEAMTHAEVLKAAEKSAPLASVYTRDETLAISAAVTRARESITAAVKNNDINGLIQGLEIISPYATDAGRRLNALSIKVSEREGGYAYEIFKKLIDLGIDTEKLKAEAANINMNDAQAVTKIFRKYVKPSVWDVLDEFAYNNILSSPGTHLVNASSNMLQVFGLRPALTLADGTLDVFGSKLKGRQRNIYASEVKPYYKGALNSVGKASRDALDVITGKSTVYRPDIKHIPTGFWDKTGLTYVSKALEAGDIFFRTMAEAGEKEALRYRSKGRLAPEEINKLAQDRAARLIFRGPIDPRNATGQGYLLSAVDNVTNLAYSLRKVPGIKYFARFVQTPMNILKQGLEYSPAGFGTIPGAINKQEQAAKALVGSIVFAGAGYLALDGRTTWKAPQGEKERKLFYSAGLQEYSIKIGNNWISYSKLGPLSYPFAMAAAMKYYAEDNPATAGKEVPEKLVNAMGGVMGFFADQSYVEGMKDVWDAVVEGRENAARKLITGPATQFVPLVSLQRWTTNLIDPYYRKGAKGLSPKAFRDDIIKGIPGLSQYVEPHADVSGKPSERKDASINATGFIRLRKIVPGALKDYDIYKYDQLENKISRLISDGQIDEAVRLRNSWNRGHPNNQYKAQIVGK